MSGSRVFLGSVALGAVLLACSSDGSSSSSGTTGSSSGSSSSSGTTALPWACLENATTCDCFNGPTTGYGATSCKTYPCCRKKAYQGGLEECACSNAATCAGDDGWSKVDHCPP